MTIDAAGARAGEGKACPLAVEARARRRARQLGRPEAEDEILGDIERRDRYDSGRTHSPLVQAADAVAVDTTELDASGVVTAIVTRVRAAGTRDGDPAA